METSKSFLNKTSSRLLEKKILINIILHCNEKRTKVSKESLNNTKGFKSTRVDKHTKRKNSCPQKIFMERRYRYSKKYPLHKDKYSQEENSSRNTGKGKKKVSLIDYYLLAPDKLLELRIQRLFHLIHYLLHAEFHETALLLFIY